MARWKLQADVRVTVLDCSENIYFKDGYGHDYGCRVIPLTNSNPPFATRSLWFAEHEAQSDPYIICNDDNLILSKDFVENGLRVMRENPEYGCISGVVTNGDGSEFELNHPGDVREIHAVGGCVFLRKGLVKEFPPLEDKYWDLERHRQIVAAGFKSGYSRHMPYLHMGAGFSIANPAFFTGAAK